MSLEKIKKALEGVETDFNLDDFQIMPKEDFTTMVEGYKQEIEDTKSKSEKSGQKVGKEMLLKELKDDLGLEYEQRKNPENLKKAYIAKFGAPETDNKYAEEQIKLLNEKYQKELLESNEKYEALQSAHKQEADNKLIHESLTASFAEYDGKTNYKTNDLVTLAKAKAEFTVVDGKVYQSKDGEPLKNDLLQAINTDAFSKDMMLQNDYIKKAEGGRVIGDETKGGKYTMEEWIASQEAQGININSQKFSENMNEAIAEGKVEV